MKLKLRNFRQQHLTNEVAKDQSDLTEKDTLRKNATAARTYLAQNKLDPYSAFKVISTLPPDVQTGLTSDKDLKDAIAQGMADDHFNKMLELQKTAQSSKHSEKDLTLAAEIASAKSIADKTGIPFDDVYMIQKTEGLLDKYQKNDFQPIR
jgi:vacuolar-type H+-ATPase catalytic subunit A/Vma1